MPDFNIKPTHKLIKNYYAELEKYAQHGAENDYTNCHHRSNSCNSRRWRCHLVDHYQKKKAP